MTEKSEKCFIPVVLNSLKEPVIVGAVVTAGVIAIVGIVILLMYLTDLAESTGFGDALNTAAINLGIWVAQNSLLIYVGFCATLTLYAAYEIRKGNKNTGYSILAIFILPVTVIYFTIRSLFWLHMLVITPTGFYDTHDGLSLLIFMVSVLVLWAVCSALMNGIDTCYKDGEK
jgi:hypothetical protein